MRIWFVDAFTDQVFSGNTAAVVPLDAWPLDAWPADETLRAIAAQNRVSETAFLKSAGLKGNYQLRWFTPTTEVLLCGHATLAAGAILLTEIETDLDVVVFDTQKGPLVVRETADGFTLDLPRRVRSPWTPATDVLGALAVTKAVDAFTGEYATIVLGSEAELRALAPDVARLEKAVRGPRAGCLTITARADAGKPYDFVCRFFAPGVGIDEDPVTGSAFADLTPYWCDRLGRDSVAGFQASARGGLVRGLQTLSSTRLLGRIAVYLRGELDPALTRLARASQGATYGGIAPISPLASGGPAVAANAAPVIEVRDLDAAPAPAEMPRSVRIEPSQRKAG
ncbi:MAG: PhzF family phenazine biosynthesis protein [Caulobacterales bacterium]